MEEYQYDSDEEECQCGELWDREVVDIGEEDRTFVRVKTRAKPFDRVTLKVCSDCGQYWLVGNDDSHNDVNCLLRLDAEAVERIQVDDVWPTDFDRYETILEMARDAGHKVRYGIEGSPLEWAIYELATERPGIRISRLASLLNLKPSSAKRLAERVVAEFGVTILFD